LVRRLRRLPAPDVENEGQEPDARWEPSIGAELDSLLHEIGESSSTERFQEALQTIAHMDSDLLPHLTERLNPNDHLCVPACVVVDQLGDEALRYFLAVTRDDETKSRIRLGAVMGLRGLAKNGSAEAFRELRRLEQDDADDDVQGYARASIDLISKGAFGSVRDTSPETGD
jgi:hypothetical protein